VQITGPSLYWCLEDLGLVAMPTHSQSDDTGLVWAPDHGYQYAILREPGKSVEVVVSDPDTAKGWEIYKKANRDRASELLRLDRPERIRVVVTFARPIPLAEARALLQAARMDDVESFTMAGQDRNGQKMGSTGFSSLPETVDEARQLAPGSSLEGLIVVIGYVWTTSDSLGQLLDDPRVHIADVTEYEIRQRMQGEDVEVSLPSPFWDLW